MSAEKTTTIRMDSRTLKRVDGIARAMSRSRAWVINEAIECYLDYEECSSAPSSADSRKLRRASFLNTAVVRGWVCKREAKVDARR